MRIQYRKGRPPLDPIARRIEARAWTILLAVEQVTLHDPTAPPFARSALAAKLASALAKAEVQRRPWVDAGKISATKTAHKHWWEDGE